MTSPIAFVTDSTCNLPEEIVRRHHITVVPVYVIFGEQSYKDGLEMSSAAFYERLQAYRQETGQMPTTSQPSPGDFQAVYERLAAQGVKEVISIHVRPKRPAPAKAPNWRPRPCPLCASMWWTAAPLPCTWASCFWKPSRP